MTAYVHLVHEIQDDDIGPEPFLSVVGDQEHCLLHHESVDAGLPEFWNEELMKHPPGFYLVRYDMGIETEGDYGEIQYGVLGDLISVTPSRKAMWLWLLNRKIVPASESFISLFRPIWCVDFEYGCIGISSKEMFLPQAVYFRYFTPKGYAAWGDNYTKKIIRCR